ncbi:MAG TPA: hypothetical protein VD996_13525 [Chitinophagaceae bacterium]|nr:hypothetical protein [Chitinophagaceae bacterium]
MKRSSIFLLFLCVLSGLRSMAQNGQRDSISMATYVAKGTQETNFMRDSLGLTEVQVTGVDSVNKTFLKNVAMLQGQSFSLAERKQKILEYEATRNINLQGILTEQQYLKYRELLTAQENRMKARLQTQ